MSTSRDELAEKILLAFLRGSEFAGCDADELARMSYEQADAMIAEGRKK